MMLEKTRPDGCLSDLRLDRVMAGEIDEPHLVGCASCAARLRALEADRDRFRAAPPALVRPEPRSRRLAGWLWPAGSLAAAAAVLLFLLWPRGEHRSEPGGTRLKGGDRIGFYVKRGDSVTRGASGDVLRAGDRVRFTYTARRAGYLLIVSVDGAGQVSVYHPDGDRAAAIEPGEEVELAGGVELDAVAGREVVTAYFCDRPVAVGEVGAGVPAGCQVDRVEWDKR